MTTIAVEGTPYVLLETAAGWRVMQPGAGENLNPISGPYATKNMALSAAISISFARAMAA